MDHDRSLELVRSFPLRPIRSDSNLDEAIRRIDELLDREALDGAERDYLDVLSALVKHYEREHHPIGPVSGAESLRRCSK